MSFWLFLSILQARVSSLYLEQQLDSVMTMGWDIDMLSYEVQITLKVIFTQCKVSKGYCAVGLSNSMTNTDMFAALSDGQTVTIGDYWSVGEQTPQTDVAQGGTTDYFYVSGGLDVNGFIDVVVKRKLFTGDRFDQNIYPDIYSAMCWAYRGDGVGWQQHSTESVAVFTWATQASTMNFNVEDDKKNHGLAMTLAWSFFAVIGIAVARYFKHNACWWYIHTIFLTITSLITILSSSITFKADEFPYYGLNKTGFKHSRLGMILSSLVISQVVFGLLISYYKIFTNNTNGTVLLNRAHKLVGYSMFIAGLYNCYLGWDLYGQGTPIITVGYILTVILFGALMIFQRFYRNRIEAPSNSLPEMTHFEVAEMVKEGKQLMFANDLVVDVKNFMLGHPGGTFMLKDCIGEDAGKYMVGCSSYGANYNPYTHSTKAFAMLKSLAIGRIPSPANYLTAVRETKNVFMEFFMSDKIQLNKHTNLLYLKSNDWNMKDSCAEPGWLGKHFLVAYKARVWYVQRYYSSLFVDLFAWATELGLANTSHSENGTGAVKLIFKVYPEGKMTNHLDGLKTGHVLLLRGPFGPGLMLQKLTGKCLALAGGTGLVPFLDLVYMAWKNFGSVSGEFSLSLFVFFRVWSDGFALDVLEKVSETCEWLDLHIITDKVRMSKGEVGEKIGNRVKEGVDLVWICGPSGFNRHYHDLVIENGMDKNKVILM